MLTEESKSEKYLLPSVFWSRGETLLATHHFKLTRLAFEGLSWIGDPVPQK